MATRKTSAQKPARKTSRRATKSAPLSGPLPPNAAELWGATLPSPSALAIHAERVARSERQLIPVVRLPVVRLPAALELETDLTVRPSYGWGLASVAFMTAVVLVCAWGTGLLHHLL